MPRSWEGWSKPLKLCPRFSTRGARFPHGCGHSRSSQPPATCRSLIDSAGSQLDAIPKRIEDVAAPNPRKAFVILSFNSRSTQARSQPVIIKTTQCRMRLLRSTKVFFHSKMKLHPAAGKPASPALRQLRRLGNLDHAEQIAIEPSRTPFLAHRHRQLHVINRGERRFRHAPMLTENRKPEARPC